MKGLRLYLPPFAPDDSGAAAIIYNLNALTVIIDAGGCAGNILSFDEPRSAIELQGKKSAVFSAGLRDMDAILGRDENLIEKISLALKNLAPEFVALVGTPVPAVIGTDYSALLRMIEKRLNIPAIAVDTNGTKHYDEGIEKTYLSLFKKFAQNNKQKGNIIGILGVSHFDFSFKIKSNFNEYDEVFVYGIDKNLETFKRAGEVKKNLVVSASGLKAAKYLEEKFNVPFEVDYSAFGALNRNIIEDTKTANKILIIHEQFQANALRQKLTETMPNADIIVGTWFLSHKKYREENDVCFLGEEEFIEYIKKENFDCIYADELFLRAIPFYKNKFVPFHHFAVSGASVGAKQSHHAPSADTSPSRTSVS